MPLPPTVLILGAGINGAALARELALGGLSVVVVDEADVASGATSYSSRLIHGGLRYLEHGEFDLVRESLAERERLARLAPHLVRPLRLFIPVANRWRGWQRAAVRFLRRERPGRGTLRPVPRGLLLVRYGLWLYNRFARSSLFPRPRSFRSGRDSSPPVDAARFPWLVSFFDAQVRYPERLTVSLLHDARRLATEQGARCDVYTYARVQRTGDRYRVIDLASDRQLAEIRPDAIVNATGAWVDETLVQLGQRVPRLMRGTKGSHIFLAHPELRAALDAGGIYVEADDGRPVFILPFGDWSLVGTTDDPYEGDPADAVATPSEIEYLVQAVRGVFPQWAIDPSHVALHYAGVRPLPDVPAGSTAAITRRHWVEEHAGAEPPLWSLIGGKLTTSRSLAEQTAASIRQRLELPTAPNSRDRVIPGGEDHPADDSALANTIETLARSSGRSTATLAAIWTLCGSSTREFLASSHAADTTSLADSPLPAGFVRWIIEREWVRRLDDLVERRLMLLYDRTLTRRCLEHLARLLVEAGVCDPRQADEQVAAARKRLADHFGKRVSP